MAFVDSSFWIALQYDRDAHQEEAQAVIRAHGGTSLVTSNMVPGETWTWLNRRAGHRLGVSFLDALEETQRLSMARIGSDAEAQALRWLRRHDERPYSFVDATSFGPDARAILVAAWTHSTSES